MNCTNAYERALLQFDLGLWPFASSEIGFGKRKESVGKYHDAFGKGIRGIGGNKACQEGGAAD